MRVMGVDPGLARCGVAVLEGDGRQCRLVAQRLVQTGADDSTEQRLAVVHQQVADVMSTWRPDALAVEQLLFNANAQSAMAVAQAVGVVLLAAAHAELPVSHYTPTQVKATVTGHGNAGKTQVKFLVRAQLRLRQAPRSADVADAAAVALCHLWSSGDRLAGGIGGHSARLAAAVAAAGPGAQVVQTAGSRNRAEPGSAKHAADPLRRTTDTAAGRAP